MLHPTLESLFFLKLARTDVVESVEISDIEEKTELINYIQNEASDYEIMHLLTLGEMPENKFDNDNEQMVWEIFKRVLVQEFHTFDEEIQESINDIIFEMGPVSGMGYSSAAPILELAKENGTLSNEFLNEKFGVTWTRDSAAHKKIQKLKGERNRKEYEPLIRTTKQAADYKAVRDRQKERGLEAKAKAKSISGTDIAKGAVAVAGVYGLYKAYKMWKAKKAAAKTPAAKQVAATKLAKISKDIKAKKNKK